VHCDRSSGKNSQRKSYGQDLTSSGAPVPGTASEFEMRSLQAAGFGLSNLEVLSSRSWQGEIIGSLGQLAKYIKHRTTASGQLTLELH
jgi:hypothetical protein